MAWFQRLLPHIPLRDTAGVLFRRDLDSPSSSTRPNYPIIPTTPQDPTSSIRSSVPSSTYQSTHNVLVGDKVPGSTKRASESAEMKNKRPKMGIEHGENSTFSSNFQPLKPMDTNRDIPIKTSQRSRLLSQSSQPGAGNLQKYIGLQTKLISLLKNKLSIVESSSISQDDKEKYIKTVYEPQALALESSLAELASSTRINESSDQPEKAYEQIDFCSQFSEDEMGRMADEARKIERPRHDQHQQNLVEAREVVQRMRYEARAEHTNDQNYPPNGHNFPRNGQNYPRNDQNFPHNDRPPLNVLDSPLNGPSNRAGSDEEDNFGERTMDGLYSSEVDDNYSDLESFIDDDEVLVDGTYRESNNPTQVTEEDSQNVALVDEISDNSDLEEIEDFTVQLNEERELQDHDVIEISSGEEDDLVPIPPIKSEPMAPTKNPVAASKKPVLPAQINPVLSTVLSDLESDLDFSDEDLCAIPDSIFPVPAAQATAGKKLPPGSEPFIKEVYSILQSTFNLLSFRPNQLEAVTATLQGKDTFVLMPTGGGKSLCYQLPALVTSGRTRGTTIVISPLISLMQDQVQHLLDKNIRAGMVSSKGTASERKQTVELFRSGQLDLVYLSPEMVNASLQIQNIISRLNSNQQLARIVVDEAHCVSSWGHDFRPDYKGMNMFKQQYPNIPLMALTATANEKVRMDIIHHLNMTEPVLLKQSFNRTNLFYEIKRKNGNYLEWIRDYIVAKYAHNTGIIYCHSKQLCEQTSEKLNMWGLKTSFYHAGMGPTERFDIQKKWQDGSVKIICATIAFGMGIDKPDVRFVIHLFIPRSLEGYYQETGRAGRDGKPSECIMFYSYKDARSLQSMIQRDSDLDRESRENHLNKLRQVVQYCENTTDCRRKQVLHYFNEHFDPLQCSKKCDNCANSDTVTSVERDITLFAKDIILLVLEIQRDKVTVLLCQDIFKGLNSSKITKPGYNRSPYHGKGKTLDKLEIERIFFHLLSENCLEEYSVMRAGFASNYVRVGRAASMVTSGQKRVKLVFTEQVQTSIRAGSLTESFVSAREIAERQALLRQDINCDPHFNKLSSIRDNLNLTISNASLKEMVLLLPTSKKDFLKVGGITKDQAQDFVHFKKALAAIKREKNGGKSSQSSTSQSSRGQKSNRVHKPSQRRSQVPKTQFRSMPL